MLRTVSDTQGWGYISIVVITQTSGWIELTLEHLLSRQPTRLDRGMQMSSLATTSTLWSLIYVGTKQIHILKYELNAFRWHTSSNQQHPIFFMLCYPIFICELSAYHLNFWPQGLPCSHPCIVTGSWPLYVMWWVVGGECVGVRVMHIHRSAPECGFTWGRRDLWI